MKNKIVWALFLLTVGFGILWIYSAAQPQMYKATASVLIDDLASSNSSNGLNFNADEINAYRILAESVAVRDRACNLARAALGEPATAAGGGFQTHSDGQLIYFQVLDANSKRAAAYANAWSEALVDETKARTKIAQKSIASRDSSTIKTELNTQTNSPEILKWEQAVVPITPFLPIWRRNLGNAFFISLGLALLSLVVTRKLSLRHRAKADFGLGTCS